MMDTGVASVKSWFTKDDGRKLPVSDDFLLPYLSPTSPGTNYWDPPPPGGAIDRQRGRILLQVHQVIDLLARIDVDLEGKSLLDIGTGNGMIPRLLLQFTKLSTAIGIDPYLDGEHKTSWQAHDRDSLFLELVDFIVKKSPGALNFVRYRDLAGFEHSNLRPAPMDYTAAGPKKFRFAKIGAHDLQKLNEKFDIFYAKAIDHIPDWAGIFKAIDAVAADDALVVIKHFSFFSYLGPHRYATTNIPWGHLLLTDAEYRRFAEEFHGSRAKEMIDFYFNGLAFPRHSMNDMTMIAREHGFTLHVAINEPLRNVAKVQKLIDQVPDFWSILRANHPTVSIEEMLSGRYHIVFKRAG